MALEEVTPDPVLLYRWTRTERPGADAMAHHVLATGHGRVLVGSPPAVSLPAVSLPTVSLPTVLVVCGSNYLLDGDPGVTVDAQDLRRHVKGFVAAPPAWEGLLLTAFPDMLAWPRVVARLDAAPADGPALPHGYSARRLAAVDAEALAAIDDSLTWIWESWASPFELAAGGHAWGAFHGGAVVSVACTFYRGARYEDIGVITDPSHRGRGLSTACAAKVCEDVVGRGHVPSWTTSTDNEASLGVAHRLGFRQVRRDVLYLCGVPLPS